MLASCFSPWTGEEEVSGTGGAGSGTVTITIGGGASGSDSAGRRALIWDPDIDSDDLWHSIRMIDSSGRTAGYQYIRSKNEGGGQASFPLTPGGVYTVMVSGWTSSANLPAGNTSAPEDRVKSTGRKTFTVPASGSMTVDVTMNHANQPVIVTFDHNSGTPALDQYQYIAKGETAVPIAAFWGGHTLDHWYEINDSPEAAFDFEHTPIDEPITLCAKWIENGGDPTDPIPDPTGPAGLYKLDGTTWVPVDTDIVPADNIPAAVSHINAPGNTPGEYFMLIGASPTIGAQTLTPVAAGITKKLTLKSTAPLPAGERVITLSGTGSLFSVEAGAELTLDAGITLKGRAPVTNTAPLVHVNGTGTRLIMKNGSTIKENKNEGTDPTRYGGGVYVGNDGSFDMEGGTISDNYAIRNAGGVYFNSTGTFTMSGTSAISGNTAAGTGTASDHGGGVYVNNGSFTMEDYSNIKANLASGYGGGVYFRGATFIMKGDSFITANSVNGSGCGVYVNAGNFTMEGGIIEGNTTTFSGANGGVYFNSTGTFTMSGQSKIWGGANGTNPNTAANGGGVYVNNGNFKMEDGSIIEGNTATGDGGGGVYFNSSTGTFTMSGQSKIWGGANGTNPNTAANGGGGGVSIARGTFTMLEDSAVEGNTAGYSGGGVSVGGTFMMQGGSISNNTAGNSGGGVYLNGGNFEMQDGSISNNIAGNNGGGVYNGGGNFAMQGGTISGNDAVFRGGGVYVDTYNAPIFTKSGTDTAVIKENKIDGSLTSIGSGRAVYRADSSPARYRDRDAFATDDPTDPDWYD